MFQLFLQAQMTAAFSGKAPIAWSDPMERQQQSRMNYIVSLEKVKTF